METFVSIIDDEVNVSLFQMKLADAVEHLPDDLRELAGQRLEASGLKDSGLRVLELMEDPYRPDREEAEHS